MYEECKNVLMYKVRKVPHISTLNWSHKWMVQWFNKTLHSMHVRFSPLLMKLPWRVFKAKRTLESTSIIFSLYFVLWSLVLLQEFLLEIISFNYNADYQQNVDGELTDSPSSWPLFVIMRFTSLPYVTFVILCH